MGYAVSNRLEDSLIPVVDLAPFRDGTDKVGVARALHEASRDVGFIYVRNHGIPDHQIEIARALAIAFFREPLERKLEVAVDKSHRGFLKIGGAKMDDDAIPDLKESYIWGLEPTAGEEETFRVDPLRGLNRWPAFQPELAGPLQTYFQSAQDVALLLLRAFALGLDLPEDRFLMGSDRPLSRASLTYYPPQPPSLGKEQFGVGPHTDFGVLTVLCQDDVGGLQVQGYDGDWIAAPPIPGTLVVNVGDLLARWTNDKYRSTPHRVINSSGKERLSLVLAYDPDNETLIDPSIVCRDGEAPKYDAITCGDYLNWRFKRAFAYRDD